MPVFTNIFYEVAALLGVAAVVGAVALRLRQPLIISFIFSGILVGPVGLGWVSAADQVDLLAKIGIALLLFVVGLKLDLHMIRTMGPVSLAAGLGQVLFTSLVGYAISIGLGLPPVAALYVAVALTFSSTIIIVKLLSDKQELDSLHGRIAIGLLLVQDLVVILVMIGLTAFGTQGGSGNLGGNMLMVLLKGAVFLSMITLLMRFVLPGLTERLARSQELLVLFAIAWAVAMASLGDFLGFSKEVGAFLAGVALASTPYRKTIGSRLVSLRDFLLLFFFIDLGARLELGLLGMQLGSAAILSLFVLIGNPLIVMVILGYMGYRKRTGFMTGLTVAQISEFSLLLGALGFSMGHIGADIVGLITLVGLTTIALSTYMILYSHKLYEWLAPWLEIFERRVPQREESLGSSQTDIKMDVVLFGLGRYGSNIASELRRHSLRILGVDFDPVIVRQWNSAGLTAQYGDIEDPDFVATMPLLHASWVVSSASDMAINLALLKGLAELGYNGQVAVTTHDPQDVETLERAGADIVLLPFRDAAKEAANQLAARMPRK